MNEKSLLKERYQLEEIIGQGGMAVVYRGRDRMLERNVAVKILKDNYARDNTFRERFRQEAKAAANLSHPNIVTVYDFGMADEQLFIVMEFVPGKDLSTIIKDRGRLELRRAMKLAIKACKGVGYAHRAGLVHCDIKPHNFMVTEDHQLKVMDFGIARLLSTIHPDEESDIVWGSPQYFSPEQAVGQAPSPASDVYSLGVVIYQMITGQPPFIGKSAQELARLHRQAQPIAPREINPFIPEELNEVVLKVLSKEPAARYRTADQLGRVLQLVSERLDETKLDDPQDADHHSEISKQDSRPIPISDMDPELMLTPEQAEEDEQILGLVDWGTVGLSLLALTSVGGLVPFGIWVFNVFFPLQP
ncbi:MAG: protein kinase [Chloroflexota bacterium]